MLTTLQPSNFRSFLSVAVMLFVVGFHTTALFAQLRIATYNTTQGPRAGMATVLEAMGEESVGGIQKPIDVLLLQEQNSLTNSTQAIVNVLNGIYGPDVYARGTLTGFPLGSDIRQAIIYNTGSVELIQETRLGTTGSTNQPRSTMRYRLRPVGYGSDAEFYAYNSHYLAGNDVDPSNGTTVGARRQAEALSIRSNSDNVLGEGTAGLYVGDYNMDSSGEQAFQTLLAGGPGQAFDPVNQLGTWHNNASFARWHSQSPCENACTSGFASGGLDDRFDFQLVTGELLDGDGLDYIPGSYHTFGNNGSTYNDAINVGNTININGLTSFTTSQVLNALEAISDHLPVVADYQVPAVMEVAVDAIPKRMVVGSSALLNLSVENSANVVSSNGADVLEYDVATSNSLVFGSIPDRSDAALGGGNVHTLFLSPSGVRGQQTGSITVTATSQATVDSHFEQEVTIDVVDPSQASFAAASNLAELTIDFGTVAAGSGEQTRAAQVFNLESTVGFTAALDLDAIEATGDTDTLSIDLTTFAALAADASESFFASLNTSEPGSFVSTYALSFSDEDVPGAANQGPLTLTLLAEVGAVLTGDYNGDGTITVNDYAVWRDTLGTSVSPGSGADGSGNGMVDSADYATWKTAFAGGVGASRGAAVPEPGSLLLLLLGAAATGVLGLEVRWG